MEFVTLKVNDVKKWAEYRLFLWYYKPGCTLKDYDKQGVHFTKNKLSYLKNFADNRFGVDIDTIYYTFYDDENKREMDRILLDTYIDNALIIEWLKLYMNNKQYRGENQKNLNAGDFSMIFSKRFFDEFGEEPSRALKNEDYEDSTCICLDIFLWVNKGIYILREHVFSFIQIPSPFYCTTEKGWPIGYCKYIQNELEFKIQRERKPFGILYRCKNEEWNKLPDIEWDKLTVIER